MDFRILANKFWIEVTGILLSLVSAALAAYTSTPTERAEKIVACVFSAGIFAAILRSRFEVLKELGEHKKAVKITVDAIELYAKASEAISVLEQPSLQDRARVELRACF